MAYSIAQECDITPAKAFVLVSTALSDYGCVITSAASQESFSFYRR